MGKKIIKNRLQLGKQSKNDEVLDGLLEDDSHLRFNRIEADQNKKKRAVKGIIIVLFTAVLVIGSIFLITTFYKKPFSMDSLSKDKSLIDNEIRKNEPANISENIHLRRGKESFHKKYYNDAIAEFKEVIESDANDRDKASALTYLGIIEDERGNFVKALEYYKRALKYNSEDPGIYRNISISLKNQGKLTEAMEYISKALTLSPENINNMMLKGHIHYHLREYSKAIEAYDSVLKIDNENAAANYNSGQAMLKMGDRISSLKFFQRAATLDSNGKISHLAYSKLGLFSYEDKRYADAIKYYQQAISIKGSDATYHYNLGLAYLQNKMPAMALKSFNSAELFGKEDSKILESIGEAYSSLNEYQKSVKIFNKLLNVNKRNFKIMSRLADIYYNMGDVESALKNYRKITDSSPASEYARIAYLNMGNIYNEIGQFDNAIDSYKDSIAISPKDARAFYSLGITYDNANQPDKALSAWKKSSMLNPDYEKPLIAIADFYYKNSDLDRALEEYHKLIKKMPELDEAHFNMAMIYYKKRQIDYAIKRFQRVAEINKTRELTRKSFINLGILFSSKFSEKNKDEGLMDKSLEYIKKALLIKPEDAEALLALGTIYYKKGMLDRAVETYYQAVKNTNEKKITSQAYNNIGKVYYKKEDYKKSLRAFNFALEADPTNEQIRINRRSASQAYEGELLN